MRSRLSWIIIALVVIIVFSMPVSAQQDSVSLQQVTEELSAQVTQLNNELSVLRLQLSNQNQQAGSDNSKYATIGLVLFLCGAFCALWAQDSGRSPWFWFVAGFIFPLLTVIALLIKNSEDISKGL